MQTIAQKMKSAQEQLAETRTTIDALLKKLEAGAEFTAEDRTALDTAKSDLETRNAAVKALQSDLDLQVRATEWQSTATTTAPVTMNIITSAGDKKENVRKEFRIIEAIRQYSTNRSLEGLYREMDQEARNEMTGLRVEQTGNLAIPSWLAEAEQRDITATTTTTGGHTIQTELQGLIPFLDPKLRVLEMGATYLPNMTGNMDFPRNDAAATAVWASAENTTSTETTPTFDKLSLTPKRITAFTDVSKQNLLQTSIAMENFVRERLNRAVMNLLEQGCLTGTGASGQPSGLLTISGTNDITIGANGGNLDWTTVVKFETETAIDNADMGKLGYLFTPGVAGFLKVTKRDVAGNGFIWEGANATSTVNGYRALSTNFLPTNLTKGTSSGVCHAAIFGNWEELMIAQWGGLDLLINPYTKGKEALVEVIVNAFYDLGVRHAASFCKCDEITIP